MKLNEAFTRYSQGDAPPASAYRQEYYAILKPMMGDVDVKDIDSKRIKDGFDNSGAILSSKIRAAALLIYILSWASEKGYCDKPDFSTSIVWQKKDKEQFDRAKAIVNRMRPTAPTQEPQEVKPKDKPKMKEKKELKKKKRGGKPFRKVCKLDPDTLEVLETFDSIKEAAAASGLVKLSSPLSRHQKGNGYYWCYAEEADTFKPAPSHGKWPRSMTVAQQKFEQAITDHISEVLAKLSDDDLIAEMRRRKWTGHITKTQNVEL
jgi:hypothetical protein